jgi:hypothetical protein
MKSFLILLLPLCFDAFAGENLLTFFNSSQANRICQQAVVTTQNTQRTYLRFIQGDEREAFFVFYKNRMSTVLIANLASGVEKEIKFEGKLVDIAIKNDEIYYLTQEDLFIVDRIKNKLIERVSTLPAGHKYTEDAYARGLFVRGTKVYFAHGTYGVSVYDRAQAQHLDFITPVVPQPASNHISMVADIEGKEGKLYLVYDDVTLAKKSKAFEGIIIWNLDQARIHRTIKVNQLVEGYYKSNLTMLRDEIMITNLSLNYRHKLSKLEGDRLMKPQQRIWKYPKGGVIGRALIKEETLYGCFNDYANLGLVSAGSFNYRK